MNSSDATSDRLEASLDEVVVQDLIKQLASLHQDVAELRRQLNAVRKRMLSAELIWN